METEKQKAQKKYDKLVHTDTSKMTPDQLTEHQKKCTDALTAKQTPVTGKK